MWGRRAAWSPIAAHSFLLFFATHRLYSFRSGTAWPIYGRLRWADWVNNYTVAWWYVLRQGLNPGLPCDVKSVPIAVFFHAAGAAVSSMLQDLQTRTHARRTWYAILAGGLEVDTGLF